MGKVIEMSMMGDLTFILGLQIKQKKNGTFICQIKYVRDLVKKYNRDQCKSANITISARIRLDQDLDGKNVDQMSYRGMIGSLLYLTASRPDIMFSVCLFARF